MGKKADFPLVVDGKRLDGRSLEELRKIEMKTDVVSRANGSAEVSFGNTIAIASVYGPRNLYPKFLQESKTGIVRARYNMLPFSTDDRKSPGYDRRSIELSKVIRLAFEPALFLSDFPKAVVDIFIDIIQADGSTRIAAINATSLALACAGVPMRDLVAACSVGKIDGLLAVDMSGKEDNYGEADVSIAMLPSKNEVSLLQMDGDLTKDEVMKLLQMGKDACMKIYELQRKTLQKKFNTE
jgi:exosome complex component RRP41